MVDHAINLINTRAQANSSAFYIYRDSDSGFNHGFPSGFFASGLALAKIHLDTACVYDPFSPTRCAKDRNHIDIQRGTVTRVSFDPLSAHEFAGINWEEPEDWGVNRTGAGYDLRGATRVCFDALSPSPNFGVQFGVGGKTSAFMSIPDQWTPVCLEFASLGLDAASLSNLNLLFTVVSNDVNAPSGGTIFLDRIRVEPVPNSQTLALSFPLANKNVGLVPAPDILPGRVPIPSDQVIANLTTIYESAMASIVLIARGNPQDLQSARLIADTFVYDLTHDNQGLPLPAAPDGSMGPHSANTSGDVALAMFEPATGRFHAGTVPVGTTFSAGIQPDAPRIGNDVINTYDFLDAQTFTTLPLAGSPLYRNAIDWRRPVRWMLDHYTQSVRAAGQQYQGFNLVATPTAGPTGVAYEFTGQAVVVMKFVDALYGEQRFEAQARFYLDQIRKAQRSAPFGDSQGLVATVMQDGDLLPPVEQCLSTPFQCIAQRVSLAATTWAILADNNGLNPFESLTIVTIPGQVTLTSPSGGATNQSTTPTLSWSASSNATSYDLYLGSSNPPPVYAQNLVSTSFAVSTALNAGTIYYWNFDEGSGLIAHDTSGSGDNGAVNGATWTAGKINSIWQPAGRNDTVSLNKAAVALVWTIHADARAPQSSPSQSLGEPVQSSSATDTVQKPLTVRVLNSGGARLSVTSTINAEQKEPNIPHQVRERQTDTRAPLTVRVLNSGGARLSITSTVKR